MTFTHFTMAYWCILVGALLPIVCAGIAKYGTMRTPRREGGYDNHNPRAWLALQTDWRARANAAQANTFEALPFFFAAVIIAHQLQASQLRLDILAVVFIALRMAYILMYVCNSATARSIVWALALFVNIGILFSGFR
ncbi:MAG: MAPEG family protein [Polaromonas sp.]